MRALVSYGVADVYIVAWCDASRRQVRDIRATGLIAGESSDERVVQMFTARDAERAWAALDQLEGREHELELERLQAVERYRCQRQPPKQVSDASDPAPQAHCSSGLAVPVSGDQGYDLSPPVLVLQSDLGVGGV